MSIGLLTLEDKETLLQGKRVYKTRNDGLKIFYEYEIYPDFSSKKLFLLVEIFYPTHYTSEKHEISKLIEHFSSLEKTSA